MEEWRPIPDYEGYEVSNLGRVRGPSGRVLPGAPQHAGHLRVWVGPRQVFIHRLVLLAFVGEPPAGHEVRHLNGRPSDNRLSNLAYATRSKNQLDRVWHGTTRLSPADVEAIRSHLREGRRQREVAAHFGVSQPLISRIKTGRIYWHV